MQMMRVTNRRLVCLFLKAQALTWLALGKHVKALSLLDHILGFLPEDRHALASRAHVLVQLNRLDESVLNLQQLAGMAGSKAQKGTTWFNLAYVLQQKGHHEEACSAFENAVLHCPWLGQAWYGLGLSLIQQRKLNAARNAIKQTTILQPMAPHGWYQLAHVDLALEEPEKARQVLDHLRRFEPKVARQLELDIQQYADTSNSQQNGRSHVNLC